MGLFEIAGLALALGGDCLSVCIGLGMGRLGTARLFSLGLLLGCAQAALLITGYVAAFALHELLHISGAAFGILGARFDGGDPAAVHNWIHRLLSVGGAALLAAIGAHMIASGAAAGPGAGARLRKGSLFLLAALVNVDSLVAGVGLGMLDGIHLPQLALLMALVGSSMAWIGLAAGKKIGRMAGRFAQPLGGGALLAIAAKVLLAELWR